MDFTKSQNSPCKSLCVNERCNYRYKYMYNLKNKHLIVHFLHIFYIKNINST